MSSPRIILATVGSLGDLHPFLAIGQALSAAGFHVVMAVPADQTDKCRAAGLEAVAILPGFDTICDELGFAPEDAARRIMHDQAYLMDRLLMPWLDRSVDTLDTLAVGAVAIVGSIFVFAAPLVAERRNLPLVRVVLQPMAMFSAYAPPMTPDFWMMAGRWAGAPGRGWNRLGYALMRQVLRRRHAADIDRTRARIGLPPAGDAVLIDTPMATRLTLACWSPLLAPPQPDAPRTAIVTGFPQFDSGTGRPDALSPALSAFLDDGPPPIVFTLGSFAVFAPGDFYAVAAEAARAMGRRAVLLVGDRAGPPSTHDRHVCAYAPHSLVFPRACAIVHHGGIGSTGQAMRAGKPQLVVPHMGDQFDNGRRIARAGTGRTMTIRRFTPDRVAAVLERMMADDALCDRAERMAAVVRAEDGAATAVAAITAMLSGEPAALSRPGPPSP